jgi:MFS-type transporter involved in bile tolerance (Atg22 family)
MCKKINPLNSFRAAEMLFAIATALIAGTVTGPEKKHLVYIYAVMIGIGFGWMFPSQRTVVVALVPKGQETEMMGLVSFFGQIIGWLPSFFFTLMNENGVNMRWGIGMVSFFLLTSFLCTLMCGDFNKAAESVAHTSDAYLQEFARRSSVQDSTLSNGKYELNDSGKKERGDVSDAEEELA